MKSDRATIPGAWGALAVGLIAFAVYAMTVAPTVLPADSGEFQLAAPLLGLVHPTGYPLYLVLGKLWTLLPFGDVAGRMNLFSAVVSALAVGSLYALGRRLHLGLAASAVAALTLAFSQTFWSQAVRAEVYALNSLFMIVLLILAVWRRGTNLTAETQRRTEESQRVPQYLYLPLFVFGLALAHHRMIVLLIPALVVLAWTSPVLPILRSRQAWLPALVALGAPLLLYAFIPLVAASAPYLRLHVGGGPDLVLYQNTLGSFMSEIAGTVFRASLAAPGADPAARLRLAFDLLRLQVGPAGLALAVLGLVLVFWRRPRLGLGLALAYAASVAFCLVYFIGDISDFFTPSYIIVCVWIGIAIDALIELARRLLKSPGGTACTVVAFLLPLTLLTGHWQANDLSKDTQTRAAWQELLSRPLPQGAILVSNDRDEMTPMWYLQYIEGERRDLVGLFPQITQQPPLTTLGALLDWLLQRGRQPYLIKPMPGLDIKYQVQSGSLLPQVTGLAAPSPLQPQRPSGATFGGQARLLGADVAGELRAGAQLMVTLYWTPQSPMHEDYHVSLQLVSAGGERLTGSDDAPGGEFYPTSVWSSGDVLVDRHELALPANLASGEYHLKVSMYRFPALTLLPVDGSTATSVDVGTVEIR